MANSAKDVLAAGESLAGENEAVVGQNNTSVNKRYGMVGQPYCGGFVMDSFKRGGSTLLNGCSNPWYVPTLRQYMESKGWARVSTPQAGDVFIEGSDMHTGLCDEYLGGGAFLTLEGNGGHVKATKDAARNGTGSTYEGIGYRRATTGNFKFYRPPWDGSGSSGGSTPAPTPAVDKNAMTKEWQTFLGVPADGKPGPDTERAALKKMLLDMLAKRPLRNGDKGDAVGVLQGLLYAAGYDPKGLDKSYGSGCAAAVSAFERDVGQTADSSAGVKVVTALWDKVFG